MEIKDIIKQKRIECGYTMNDLADLLDVNISTISRWESGELSTMKHTKIAALANALHISPADLFEKNNVHPDYKPFSYQLKNLLEVKGLKPTDLAVATGINKSTISNYLSGKYEPKQKNIYKIAMALGVKPSYLLGVKTEPEPVTENIRPQVQELIPSLNKLDDIDLAEVKGEVKGMLKQEKYKSP